MSAVLDDPDYEGPLIEKSAVNASSRLSSARPLATKISVLGPQLTKTGGLLLPKSSGSFSCPHYQVYKWDQ
jgi:hypothetical protein